MLVYPPAYPSPLWKMISKLCILSVGSLSKLFLNYACTTKVYHMHRLEAFINERSGRGLLTFSNHRSTLDDPLMWGILPHSILKSERMRWSLGAHDILFTQRVIPAIRGTGLHQKGMSIAVEKLRNGEWIHIFPEGKVTFDRIRYKWGIARLILECDPIVIPIHLKGMDEIKPYHATFPRLNKELIVTIGDPIQFEKSNSNAINRIKVCNDLQHAMFNLSIKKY